MITLPLTYTIVEDQKNDIQYTIPYISNTINFPPESSIGTFGLTLTGVMGIMIVFIRYCDIYLKIGERSKINLCLLIIGIISFLGLVGLSSFQIRSIEVVHIIFSYIFFACGVLYMCIMSLFEGKVFTGMKIRCLRRCLSVMVLVSSLTYLVPSFYKTNLSMSISALGEICTALFILCFLVSYYNEFRDSVIKIVYMDLSTEENSPLVNVIL